MFVSKQEIKSSLQIMALMITGIKTTHRYRLIEDGVLIPISLNAVFTLQFARQQSLKFQRKIETILISFVFLTRQKFLKFFLHIYSILITIYCISQCMLHIGYTWASTLRNNLYSKFSFSYQTKKISTQYIGFHKNSFYNKENNRFQ